MISIHHLFPPEEINNLPTWRFILHFETTEDVADNLLLKIIEQLKSIEWEIIEFPFGLDTISFNKNSGAISIPIEISENRRKLPSSLSKYESDFWKLVGHLVPLNFSNLYYQAIDWREENQAL